MKLTVREIRAVRLGEYEATLSAMGGEHRFIFRVDDAQIPVVAWPKEFATLMRHNVGPAKWLFESILALHKAQSIELP
jgi:hypothetical protein